MTATAAIQRIPAKSLHISKPTWWLESRFHFPFAGFWRDDRVNFGALRVLNDDLVKPHSGFGTHPHRDAEIFSYIVDGKLSHKDSMGNKEALGRGAIQYLSAGTGITHSELNDDDVTTRFLQVWLTPDRRNHDPQYGSASFPPEQRHNRLHHILGGTSNSPNWKNSTEPSSIHLHQDANIFVSESDPGQKFSIPLGIGRQAYMVCIEGSLKANDTQLNSRDAAEIVGSSKSEVPLEVEALDPNGAHFMVIEMAKV